MQLLRHWLPSFFRLARTSEQSSADHKSTGFRQGRSGSVGWLGRFSRTVRNTLALVGLSAVGLSVLATVRAEQRLRTLVGDRPGSVILEIPLDSVLVSEEEPLGDVANWRRLWGRLPFSAYSAPTPVSLFQLTRALEDASQDPRVAGILTTAGSNQARAFGGYANPIGAIEELSKAIGAFMQSERPTAFYASSFENTAAYFLAVAHEQIYMHPAGIWNVVGLSAGGLFLRDFLDARGVRVEVIRCGEYKTAANAFTESAYTPAHREAVQALLSTFYASIVGAIATARQSDKQRIEELIDMAPLSAPETLEAGLVNALVFPDKIRERVRTLVLSRMQRRVAERQEARDRLEKILNNPQAFDQLSDTVESWLQTRPWETALPNERNESASEWVAVFDALNRARRSAGGEHREAAMDAALVLIERVRRLLERVSESGSGDEAITGKRGTSVNPQHSFPEREVSRDDERGLRFCPITQYIAERALVRSQLERAHLPWSEWLKQLLRTRTSPESQGLASLPVIAIIPVTGTLSETSVRLPVKTIMKAAKDPQVRAVVIRVASPGGTVTAAENIRHAVEQCASEKPVIASFGHVAASGGYLAALPAKHILAPACSITGSIGVILLKLNVLGAANRLGIQFDHVSMGKNAPHFAALSSLFQKLEQDQQHRLESLVDWQYALFCGQVARFRHLNEESVQKIAQGRIWSGYDAVRLGIVDRHGGLQEAIRLARQEAQLAPWDLLRVDSRYGRPSGSIGEVFRRFLSQGLDDSEQDEVLEPVPWPVVATFPAVAQKCLRQYMDVFARAPVHEPMALWLEGLSFWIDS